MVVVIDDEEQIVKVISSFLKLMNPKIQIVQVTDPTSALNIVKSNDVELVFVDIIMPGKDGLTLVKEIREFSNVKVIVISSLVKALQHDIRRFDNIYSLQKPFYFEDLEEIVSFATRSGT